MYPEEHCFPLREDVSEDPYWVWDCSLGTTGCVHSRVGSETNKKQTKINKQKTGLLQFVLSYQDYGNF